MALLVRCELRLDGIPARALDDGRMLSRVGLPLVRDLADVERVRQDPVEVAAGKGAPAGTAPLRASLADKAESIGFGLQPPHAAELEVKAEESPHRFRLG